MSCLAHTCLGLMLLHDVNMPGPLILRDRHTSQRVPWGRPPVRVSGAACCSHRPEVHLVQAAIKPGALMHTRRTVKVLNIYLTMHGADAHGADTIRALTSILLLIPRHQHLPMRHFLNATSPAGCRSMVRSTCSFIHLLAAL